MLLSPQQRLLSPQQPMRRSDEESAFEEPELCLQTRKSIDSYVDPPAVSSLPWYAWVLCGSIDILGPFSTDSYIPNMPDLEDEFGCGRILVGLTLQLNWIVKGFSNVWLGSLSDRLGRKRVILGSFLLYIAATASCAVAPNIYIFLAARIVQGVGEGNATITSAIARDVLQDPLARMRMMALLGTIRPVAIIAAPSIGGLLGSVFGWRTVFMMLCCWGTLNAALTLAVLPETTTPTQREDARHQRLWANVLKILRHRESLGFILTFSLVFAGAMSMLSNVAWLLEDHFGLSLVTASLLIGSVPCTMIVASLLVAVLGGKTRPPPVVLQWGMLGIGAAAVWCWVVAFLPWGGLVHRWWVVQSCFYVMVLFQSVAMPPCMALYMQPWKDEAGLASGAMALVRTLGSSLLAIGSTTATNAYGVRGLLGYIGGVLWLPQVAFWCVLDLALRPPDVPLLDNDARSYRALPAASDEGRVDDNHRSGNAPRVAS